MTRLSLIALFAACCAIPSVHAEAEMERMAASFAGAAENAVKYEHRSQHGNVVVFRGTDPSGNTSFVAMGAPASEPARGAAPSDGMPVFDDVPQLPRVSESPWGSYRPSIRKSQHIEHVAGVVNAGYLR